MMGIWRRLKLGGRLCLLMIAAYFALAVYGEVQYRVAKARDVTPSYNVVHEEMRYQPPSWSHPMGTDNLGRDVAQRLVQGARLPRATMVGSVQDAVGAEFHQAQRCNRSKILKGVGDGGVRGF